MRKRMKIEDEGKSRHDRDTRHFFFLACTAGTGVFSQEVKVSLVKALH